MPPPRISHSFLTQLRSLALSPSSTIRPSLRTPCLHHSTQRLPFRLSPSARTFATTPARNNWLAPPQRPRRKQHKGRPQVNTGGSTRGTTLAHGSWGIRLQSPGQRIPASNFRIAEETIKRRLKGEKYRIFTRVSCNIAVYTSGNDQRMGKGKGSFDFWAARVAHGRVVLEIGGDVHEHLVRDALRLAGNKLPGQWEFIKKDDPPIVGATKWRPGMTKEELFRPKRTEPLHPLHVLPDGTKVADQVTVSAARPTM